MSEDLGSENLLSSISSSSEDYTSDEDFGTSRKGRYGGKGKKRRGVCVLKNKLKRMEKEI